MNDLRRIRACDIFQELDELLCPFAVKDLIQPLPGTDVRGSEDALLVVGARGQDADLVSLSST